MDLFTLQNMKTEHPSNENFMLHTHDNYEIFLFLEGNATYIVEGKNYTLQPYDIIIIRKHEFHRIYHNSSCLYKRIVLNINPEFFKKYHCEEYEKQFLNTSDSIDNKISAEVVQRSGIYDAVIRLKRYTDNFKNTEAPITVSIITEILYLINNLHTFSRADTVNGQFQKIISYVNANFTDDISLDKLANMFFISKYHLCRLFKKNTGMTMHSYVNQKRFLYIKDMLTDGITLGEASANAGFGSYPSFYRAYVKVFGKPPKSEI